MSSDEFKEKYHTLLRNLQIVIENKGNDEYKNKYHALIRNLGRLNDNIIYRRCPPIKSCCGACNKLKDLINKAKNDQFTDDFGTDEGLHEHKQ